MPRGQHRPGVKVIQQNDGKGKAGKKTPEYLAKQLKSAKALEEQLSGLSKEQSSGEMGMKLRTHLCEVLSDVILCFPAEALKEDCFNRMWKGSFYKAIQEWRSRLSKEKRKNSSTLRKTQQLFQHFLDESIDMYDFLIGAYLRALTHAKTPTSTPTTSQSQDSAASSQDSLLLDSQLPSQDDSSAMIDQKSVAPLNAATEPGVVQGLCKLFIHMGDLQRYAENFSKADNNYLNASKLAPGLGNAYNQMAVVDFGRDNFCNSLYWYARSLMTTHGDFSTSLSNVKRLFAANREKLVEFGRDTKPTVLSAQSQSSLMSNAKKVSKDDVLMAKAQKNAANKSCLAHFVDLHYDFFLMQENGAASPSQDQVDAVRAKMTALLASMDSLLQVQAYSDSLLCKLVVVSISSFERCKSATPSASVSMSRQLSAEFLYMLGSSLAARLEVSLTKMLEKANPGKNMASVKLLLPLEILAEFVCDLLLEQPVVVSNSDDTSLSDVERVFWTSVAKIGSMVLQLVDRYKVPMSSLPSPVFSLIKEYQVLKGFRPLHCINEQYIHSKDGFVDPVTAMDLMDLTQNTQSQVSGGASTVSGGGSEENRAKLARWLELCRKFASNETNAPLATESGESTAFVYKIQATDDDMADASDHEPQDDGVVAMQSDDDDDDAGDVVVYQLPRDGVGPPLLTPGNLLSGSTKSPAPLQQSYQQSYQTYNSVAALGDDNQKENSASASFQPEQQDVVMQNAPAPPAVMPPPPPGFGPPLGVSTQAGQMSAASQFPPSNTNNLLGQIIPGPDHTYPGSVNPMPPPTFANSGNVDYLFGSSKPLQGRSLTVAESPHLFGDLHTENPFATPIGVPVMNFDNAANTSGFGDHQETSLLDSGLLNSLFGEDVKSKNPWTK